MNFIQQTGQIVEDGGLIFQQVNVPFWRK